MATKVRVVTERSNFVKRRVAAQPVGKGRRPRSPSRNASRASARLRVRVVAGDVALIGEPGHIPTVESIPIDAIAVGHYRGVRPVNAERALDVAISKALGSKGRAVLPITQLTERQIIVGEKARPFLLPDPRRPGRTIAIVGMGYPQQFSIPELVALVQALAWSLGLLGKKHLATVLIGGGSGNLSVDDAIEGWLRGLSVAADEASRPGAQLKAVTFVEARSDRLVAIEQALKNHAENRDFPHIEIIKGPPETSGKRPPPPKEVQPAYVTVGASSGTLQIGSIGANATANYNHSGAQSSLIFQLNNDVILASGEEVQVRKGAALHQMIFQKAAWDQLPLHAPLVVTSDQTAAEIAWEMLVEPLAKPTAAIPPEVRFLGLSRGLTRQLQVESPRPPSLRDPGNSLNVLIVADPSAAEPLPAAREEAKALVRLFENYDRATRGKRHRPRVQVTPLIGPEQATLGAVMEELTSESYDVLHYVGHCIYDLREPRNSGLIFSDKERLTAADIGQLDKVPSFVFANACYSGLVRRRGGGSGHSAPTLAQAFLLGGVSNLVCAAWSVNTLAGVAFAKTLYQNLIGTGGTPQPMHFAMRRARLAARASRNGATTWGAYQHYGNPYFRLLAEPA